VLRSVILVRNTHFWTSISDTTKFVIVEFEMAIAILATLSKQGHTLTPVLPTK